MELAYCIQWRHNGHDGVSNHPPPFCLFNRLFGRRSKLRVTGHCAGNSPMTGEFHAQMASYVENVSIWWRHHGLKCSILFLNIATAFGKYVNVYIYITNDNHPSPKVMADFFQTQKLTWCPHPICTMFGGCMKCMQVFIFCVKYIDFLH